MSAKRGARALPRLIGVIHLPALAGTPGTGAHPAELLHRAGKRAIEEARKLERAGFHGLILENFGDVPFHKIRVPPETVASLAVIAAAVREGVRIPIGINVLRNDARAALAVAAVTGCDFIRVNVLSGVAATDQGLIEGDAAGLLRERESLGASDVAILADVDVKHARSLSGDDIELGVEELLGRAGADAVIVTGPTTGRAVDPARLAAASRAAKAFGAPVFVGSGASLASLPGLLAHAQGVIVGSALRAGGRAGAALSPRAVAAFPRTFRQAAARARRPRP